MIVRKHIIGEDKIVIFLTCTNIRDCEFVYNFAKELARLQAHYLFTQEIIYSCEGGTFCFRLKNIPLSNREILLKEINNLLQEVSDG